MRFFSSPYTRCILLIVWTVFLCILGIKSLVTHDSRFWRGMFHQQVTYKLIYTYADADTNSNALPLTKKLFKGKSYQRIFPNEWHQSRYGIWTVRAHAKSILYELRDKKLYPPDARMLTTRLQYHINKDTALYTIDYSLSLSHHDAKVHQTTPSVLQ